jgi:hypothetical protein
LRFLLFSDFLESLSSLFYDNGGFLDRLMSFLNSFEESGMEDVTPCCLMLWLQLIESGITVGHPLIPLVLTDHLASRGSSKQLTEDVEVISIFEIVGFWIRYYKNCFSSSSVPSLDDWTIHRM